MVDDAFALLGPVVVALRRIGEVSQRPGDLADQKDLGWLAAGLRRAILAARFLKARCRRFRVGPGVPSAVLGVSSAPSAPAPDATSDAPVSCAGTASSRLPAEPVSGVTSAPFCCSRKTGVTRAPAVASCREPHAVPSGPASRPSGLAGELLCTRDHLGVRPGARLISKATYPVKCAKSPITGKWGKRDKYGSDRRRADPLSLIERVGQHAAQRQPMITNATPHAAHDPRDA